LFASGLFASGLFASESSSTFFGFTFPYGTFFASLLVFPVNLSHAYSIDLTTLLKRLRTLFNHLTAESYICPKPIELIHLPREIIPLING